MTADRSPEGNDAALAAIRRLHAAQSAPMPDDLARDLAQRHGAGQVKLFNGLEPADNPQASRRKAGRPPMPRTIYERSLARWKNLYRLKFKNAVNGTSAASFGSRLTMASYVTILQKVVGDARIKPHKRAQEVIRRLAINGLTQPDMKTVRQHLKRLAKTL